MVNINKKYIILAGLQQIHLRIIDIWVVRLFLSSIYRILCTGVMS